MDNVRNPGRVRDLAARHYLNPEQVQRLQPLVKQTSCVKGGAR